MHGDLLYTSCKTGYYDKLQYNVLYQICQFCLTDSAHVKEIQVTAP